MDEILIPEDANVVYYDKMSKTNWFSKDEWDSFREENPKIDLLYDELDKKDKPNFFMVFFTTENPHIKEKGWEHLMGVYGNFIKDEDFGIWIEVLGISWYGFPVKSVNNMDDLREEAELYFEDLYEHLELLESKTMYYTFGGEVLNYEDLLTDIIYLVTKGNLED